MVENMHNVKNTLQKKKWEGGSKTNSDFIHLYCGFVSAQAV